MIEHPLLGLDPVLSNLILRLPCRVDCILVIFRDAEVSGRQEVEPGFELRWVRPKPLLVHH